MFHTPGTRAGLRKRPGYPASNGQVIYDLNGGLVGSNITISSTGALTGNGFGLTLLANSGIVSNSTGVFANIGAGLNFVSGATAVLANNGLVSNSTGVFVIANNGLVSNSTGVFVIANNGLVSNSTGVFVIANSGLVSNSTGVFVLANNGIVTNSTGTFVNADAHFSFTSGALTPNTSSAWTLQDMTLNGNLSVLGTMTTLNVQTLQIKDNMIQLGEGIENTTTFTDNLDTGWYVVVGNTSTNCFSGMARIASLSTNTNPYFKLFQTNTAVNTTTINSTAAVGTLQGYLAPWGTGGAFVVNSTSITITCNSTVGVPITANSLSLTTPLAVSNIAAGSDGQVLQYATGSGNLWGMLDGGTFKYTLCINTRSTRLIRSRECQSVEEADLCTYGMIENIRGII